MGGYQMLVRGEIMRGRYRNSFEFPEAFVPNQPTQVKFSLPDIYHKDYPGFRFERIITVSAWDLYLATAHCRRNTFVCSASLRMCGKVQFGTCPPEAPRGSASFVSGSTATALGAFGEKTVP